MAGKKTSATGDLSDVMELTEAFIPEFAARLAAIEHILVEKKFCSFEDLRKAREFVDMKREIGAAVKSGSLCRQDRRPPR